MSRYELRFLRRHPFQWAACWWLHLLVCALLVILAVAWSSDIYEPLVGGIGWTTAAALTSGLVLASALSPREYRLVATTGVAITALFLFRASAYLQLLVVTEIPPALLVSLTTKSLGLSALGVTWPTWTRQAAIAAVASAGEDDRATA